MNPSKKFKFRLVHPIIGTNIYQTSSVHKGVKKCYSELKLLDNLDISYFSVQNIDTNETYTYKVNNKRHEIINTIKHIQNDINNINARIDSIENKFEKKSNSNSNYNIDDIPIHNTIPINTIINHQSHLVNNDELVVDNSNSDKNLNKEKDKERGALADALCSNFDSNIKQQHDDELCTIL